MGQFCDSVNSMPVEERNELNTQALQDIYGSIDMLTDGVNSTNGAIVANGSYFSGIGASIDNLVDAVNSSDNGSYLHEIKGSIDNLAEQTSELNKSLLYLTQIIK